MTFKAQAKQCMKARGHTGWFCVENGSSRFADLKLGVKAKKEGAQEEARIGQLLGEIN